MAVEFVRLLPIPKVEVFDTPGSTTFDATQVPIGPDGKRWVEVEVIGGGAGGGGASSDTARGGGGAGGYARGLVDVTGETNINVTVGAAGVGSSNASGTAGGSSSFGAFLTAEGGNPGLAASLDGGAGGAGSGGDINTSGQNGQDAITVNNSRRHFRGGKGGDSLYGVGGNPGEISYPSTGASISSNGGNAAGYGGGGGGGAVATGSCAGGNGSPGFVIVRWYE